MIWKQFTHLGNFPPELKARFNSFLTTEFDDSLSVEMQLRSIIKWCQGNFKTVDTLIDFINELSNWLKQFENTFDTKLEESVIAVLSEWQASGHLDVVISEALQWELDEYKITNEEDKNSIFTQLNQIGVNVKEFGAKGDGVTDDTVAIQQAVDYAKNNALKTIIFPYGAYVVSHIDFLGKEYSGLTLKGIGATLVQKKDVEARNDSADGLLFFDSLSNLVDDAFSDVHAIKDILITGLIFEADIEDIGFNELIHHIYAHGVSRFTVEDCVFNGFLGDAIAINRGHVYNAQLAFAYNSQVTIRNNRFDGINKNNRQAISIYHCDSFVIDNNIIKNTTRNDMPGAIDIEPDSDNVIVRSGVITNNKIDNVGGDMGAICILIKNKDTTQTKFVIANNTITNTTKCGISVSSGNVGVGSKNTLSAISIYDNYLKDCHETIRVHWINGVHIYDNYFENIHSPNDAHFLNADNVVIENNFFKNMIDMQGVIVQQCVYSVIRNNYFYNPTVKALVLVGWIFELRANKFLTTDGGTEKTAFELNEQLLLNTRDLHIEDNTVDGGYNDIKHLTKCYFIVPGGKPTYFSLPAKFPIGTTRFVVETSDHPLPDYNISRTGTIVTFRDSFSDLGVFQLYVSVDSQGGIFFRRSVNAQEWTGWYSFNTTYNGTTANRPNPSHVLPGTQYFDLNLQKPVFSNGVNWVDSNGQTL